MTVRGIRIDWDRIDPDSYLCGITALREIETMEFTSPVTFFTGENGSGKSTLLEALAAACGFNPEGGTKNYLFSTRDSHSDLWRALTVLRTAEREEWGFFLRAESFYNVATMEEEYTREKGIPLHLHEKSHGESFLDMLKHQIRGRSLYIMDEPEAALSPQRQMTLLKMIYDAVKEGSQFIIATHSPVLLACPGAEILSFDEGHVHRTAYEDTPCVRITSLFINGRQRILHRLLDEEEAEQHL